MDKREILIEHNISKTKIKTILNKIGGVDNFENLSENQKAVVGYLIISELSYLERHNILNENFFRLFTSLGLTSAAIQTLIEPFINRVLRGLGLPDILVFPIVSTITRNPTQLLRAFVDCRSTTKLFVEVIIETIIMYMQKYLTVGPLKFSGFIGDFVRNAVIDTVKSSNFDDKLFDKLENKVCEMIATFKKEGFKMLKSGETNP